MHYAAFTADYDENTLPYEAETDYCAVRLWRLDSYLVAIDNNKCGGMNVTFTGLTSPLVGPTRPAAWPS